MGMKCHHFGVAPFYEIKHKGKQEFVSQHWKCLAHWNEQKRFKASFAVYYIL